VRCSRSPFLPPSLACLLKVREVMRNAEPPRLTCLYFHIQPAWKRSASSSPPIRERTVRVDRSPVVQVYPNPCLCRGNQSQIYDSTPCALPDQVSHPPLAISASIIKPEMNCPYPRIHNPPTRLEEGRRRWPSMNRYKQGSNGCEKNCRSDVARVPRGFAGGEKPGHDGQWRGKT
jgi:hypothetical protein